MRVYCCQHVEFEGPAAIGAWLEEQGHELVLGRHFAGDPVPSAEAFDALVVMGGPMSVNDPLPWIADETRLIEMALAGAKPTLGVCLGAQLIASVLGARVYPGPAREIGWLPVTATPSAVEWGFPEQLVPLHWHGETFDLPAGATHLASSAHYLNQAFAYQSALALQFHVEATSESVAALVVNAGHEIGDGPAEQPAAQITREADMRTRELSPILRTMLARWLPSR